MTSRNIYASLALCFVSMLGTPRGGPSSPMLSNVVSDELGTHLGVRRCIAPQTLALGGLFGPSAFSRSSILDDVKGVNLSSKLHPLRDLNPAGNTATACFDVTTNGANIGQIFIDNICGPTVPEEFVITVDGEPVTKLHTEDSPCPELPSDVFFSLTGHQSTAHVCVSVLGASGGCISVGAKAGDECLIASVPLFEDCTCSGN
jgi:hypothetical protein